MKSLKWFAGSLPGFAAIVLAGWGGSSVMQQPLLVAMGGTPAAVQPGATAQISATVSNDSSNKGVNWTVTCPTAPCGSVAPPNTARGAPTTYTAPAIPPAGDLTVTITAAAAADGTTAVSANFKVPGITVNVPPPSATMLQVNATAQVTANVTGDTAAKGVTWTVSCGVAACGSVTPTTTLSGVATTYKAPATAAGSLTVTIAAASATNSAATGSTTVTITGITISIAPPSSTVKSAGTEPIAATVSNDPSSGGVTWSLQITRTICNSFTHVCHTSTSACTVGCGGFSATTTASGVATTYTAPVRPPFGIVAAVATSVTNAGAKATAPILILRISISVAPPSATVVVNATQPLTATVINDGANGGAGAGVTWTLLQNGAACSPDCGTISPANTASGAPATYTAPATVPAFPVLTIVATSVTDTTKLASATITVTTVSGAACGAGSGSESLLKGQYAYRLQAVLSNSVAAIAGSFTADGTGKVTGGEEDASNLSAFQIDPATSSYAVGPDHRGCLTLGFTNRATTYFRFALGGINSSNIATAGHIIEFDDTNGSGSRFAGTLKIQDATSFFAGQFKGNYVVGLVGLGGSGGRFAAAGTLASDGISAVTSSNFDTDDAGTLTSNIASAPGGTFTCCSANGRGTLQFTGSSFTSNLVLYMVSSGDVFFVGFGPGQHGGEAVGVLSGTTFTQASLNGTAVFRKTAQSTGPIVDVALASANATGGISITDNTNSAGTFSTGTTAFTYTVASNGRVTLTGGTNPPVLYLYGKNAGFLVGTDANVDFGAIEAQAAGPFNNASLSGAYTLGTENPSTDTAALESAAVTLNGAGTVSGTSDQSSPAGLVQNQNLSLTYSVGANGQGSFGSGTTAILISGNKVVFINNTSVTPTIIVVEK